MDLDLLPEMLRGLFPHAFCVDCLAKMFIGDRDRTRHFLAAAALVCRQEGCCRNCEAQTVIYSVPIAS